MNGVQDVLGAGQSRSTRHPISPVVAVESPTQSGRPKSSSSASRKRTLEHATATGISPESADTWDEKDEGRIGVKRACNECRQQKLRCDVIQDPYTACSRCKRCNLECRIDANFRRVGKRKKNAEMEKEIVELRNQLAAKQMSPQQSPARPLKQENPMLGVTYTGLAPASLSQPLPRMSSPLDQYLGSHEAVASLLDLKSGGDSGSYLKNAAGKNGQNRRLEDLLLLPDQVQEMFTLFFVNWHPCLPILEPDMTPDEYYEACPLLFWTVISVAARRYPAAPNILQTLAPSLSRLLWVTIADVPQSYHVVKSLCIMCTWPLPVSSTSQDPTFMISGLMMQIAMQIGLHRPSHGQDFSKFKVNLRKEELRDRVKTWSACNVVAQRVATGYGQPSSSLYDWTLQPVNLKDADFKLPGEFDARLRIEMFCDKVTKALYSNERNPVGLANDHEKTMLTQFLAKDLTELEETLTLNLSSVNTLYLRAAALHLRLSVFFDPPTSKTYRQDLLALWLATTRFLEGALSLENVGGYSIQYATNYMLQMIIAGGFTLLKLLNSSFANLIDREYGKTLFTKTIRTIRTISISNNDLPSRLAEVLAQLWRAGGAGKENPDGGNEMDDSLQIKVRCRMSMSLVYDSVWRWREEFQAKGKGNLESALKNPTNPDAAVESSASSVFDQNVAPSTSGIVTPALGENPAFGEWNNEVFDPLNWMLDGLVDFPYSFSNQGVDGSVLSI